MAKRKATATDAAEPAAEYTVVARRYRPQQFADLVGQDPVARALSNAITTNRVAHAYLFTGTRGVGKTTAARILAKALNCVKGPTPTPCDECESCLGVTAGQDVDVLEIDGASNRGIDQIRDLRSNTQFRPSRSRYKIYIIDEVHMLTREAFNALLKTLEEPPSHVKFIFATTDAQKVPITILSRCQRFDFLGIAGERITDRLREVVKGEGREADDDALRIVARRAAGSMRDAQSLLDQLLAFGEERLTAAQVHKLLGTAAEDQVTALAAAILSKDTIQALTLLGSGLDGGLQASELLDQLIEYWRDLMLVSLAGPKSTGINCSAAQATIIAGQATGISLDTILAGLDVLQSTKFRLRGSAHGRVLMEMALVRLSRLEDLAPLTQLVQALQGNAPEASLSASKAGPTSPRPIAPPEAVKKKPIEADEPAAPIARPLTAENVPETWGIVLAQVGPMMASQLEKAGLPAISGPNTLVLTFDSVYNRQRDYCSDAARQERVHEALKRRTGSEWKIRIETGTSSNGAVVQAPVRKDNPENSLRQSLFQSLESVLSAKLVKIDDNFGALNENADETAVVTEEP